jgi:hypothetical protein
MMPISLREPVARSAVFAAGALGFDLRERRIMRLSIKIIVGTAIVAVSVAAATFSASAPARASESVQASPTAAATDLSARKTSAKPRSATQLRVTKLSRGAADPPNPNRPYYHPVPHFYPFAQNRGYF